MMLAPADGPVRAVVRPEIARRARLDEASDLSADELGVRLARAGVTLHDPDHLFYLPAHAWPAAADARVARRLTALDRAAFDAFQDAASEQDREDAWVELDHWAVFGCFEGDRLVSAASLCLWQDSAIADLGVLTLAPFRGRGIARTVVRSICGFSRQQGFEPQYRCQLDNHASVALARACGLVPYGKWMVAADALEREDG